MKKKDNNKTKELYQKIVDGVQKIIDSGEYQRFLKFSKNFRNYSFNNLILIFSQKEDATYVAGFKAWQTMGRKIKKGEKGIQIMYPLKKKNTVKITGQKSLLDKNEEDDDEKVVEYLTYRPTYVYDISQTTGDEISLEMKKLDSNNKKDFFEFLKNYSKYPVLEKDIFGNGFGYWSPTNQHIVLEKTLSVDDKVSTLLHELTHALYDDFDYKENRDLSEIFVESVAYIVADFFDLDTSMCSFDYITKWSNGEMKPILELGNKVQKTANDFINKLEKEFYNDNVKLLYERGINMRKKNIIKINQYNNLLKKLKEIGLVTPNGFQLRSREYCKYHDLGILNFSDQIIYSGTLIEEIKELSDYEIVMLMAKEDVIAYDVTQRKDNGYFLIKVFKLKEKR